MNSSRIAKAALLLVCVFTLARAAPAAAEGVKIYPFDGTFDDATFALESAIVDRGLVIDYVSHVGTMLNRTKSDVGGGKDLFGEAQVFLFCSAVLSRRVMEADADNIAFCPYGIFVAEAGDGSGAVRIGYRELPAGPMQEVQALLDQIVQDARGN